MSNNKEKPHIPGSQLEKPPHMRAVQPFTREEYDQVFEVTGCYPTIADAFEKAGGTGDGFKQLMWILKNQIEASKIFAQAIEDGAHSFYFRGTAVGPIIISAYQLGGRFSPGRDRLDSRWFLTDRIVLVD